jgi:hypothetical protein
MNNQELKNFRKDFHDNIELAFFEKHRLSIKDYEKVLRKTIKNTKISDESSREIYVYMGSFGLKNGNLAPTPIDDKSVLFRRYKDIETETMVLISKENIRSFESENYVVYAISSELTEEGYEEAYDIVKYRYFIELLHSSEMDAYRLIKRLNPSK